MQILACSATLGNCCSDPALAMVIETTRRVFEIIQIVVPIMLIVWASLEVMKMIVNPEEAKLKKSLVNKFIAAAIIFFIPTVLNLVLGMMPQTFQVSSCWKAASTKAETLKSRTATYIPIEEGKKHKMPNPDDYEKGKPKTPAITGGSGLGRRADGTVHGSDVAAYALQFVGEAYDYNRWNGELPYVPTTCIGFIEGVYKHFGIKVDWTEDTDKYMKNPKKYTVVTNQQLHPGDIVVYSSHYAMITGNGTEIVHAMGKKYGIRTSRDYRKGQLKLLGVVRVNGVI